MDVYVEKSQQAKEGGGVRKKSAKNWLFSFDGFPKGQKGQKHSLGRLVHNILVLSVKQDSIHYVFSYRNDIIIIHYTQGRST